jgi:hypothetical protein
LVSTLLAEIVLKTGISPSDTGVAKAVAAPGEKNRPITATGKVANRCQQAVEQVRVRPEPAPYHDVEEVNPGIL